MYRRDVLPFLFFPAMCPCLSAHTSLHCAQKATPYTSTHITTLKQLLRTIPSAACAADVPQYCYPNVSKLSIDILPLVILTKHNHPS